MCRELNQNLIRTSDQFGSETQRAVATPSASLSDRKQSDTPPHFALQLLTAGRNATRWIIDPDALGRRRFVSQDVQSPTSNVQSHDWGDVSIPTSRDSDRVSLKRRPKS